MIYRRYPSKMKQPKWNRELILLARSHRMFDHEFDYIYYIILMAILMQRISFVRSFGDLFQDPAGPEDAKCDVEGSDSFLIAYCGRYLQNSKEPKFGLGEPITLTYTVPKNLNKNIKVLDLRSRDNNTYTTVFIQREPLMEYPQLQQIFIHYNWITHVLHQDPKNPTNLPPVTVYKDIFKDLKSLELLHFTYSDLKDVHVMKLPRSLKTLVLDKNKYRQNLDASWCPNIEEISANNNQLVNIPKLSNPVPPLKTLRLRGNPLTNMTILDIAPLCQLTLLELQFPPNSHFNQPNSKDSYCQCETLRIFTEKAAIKVEEKLTCVRPPNTGTEDCTEYSEKMMKEARSLRLKCPLKAGFVVPTWVIIAGIFVLLSVLAAIGYLLWLSKFWQQWTGIHNLTPSYLEGEEIEEEILSSRESESSSESQKQPKAV